jgi:uncharacterized repeat protein (TIGR01451 family)
MCVGVKSRVQGWLRLSAGVAIGALASTQPALPAVQSFTTTATSGSFTVPAGVTRIQILARGASGGLATGSTNGPGAGATVTAVYNVTPGTLIRFVVGQAGATGDLEAGGGGGTGVFIGTTLVMVAGGGGGEDNTGNGHGGRATVDGSTGGTATTGGAGGTGGNGGGGGNAGGITAPVGDGGGGGGGINSAGGNVASAGGSTTTGGGQADTNVADGLSVSAGGTSNQTTDPSGADNIGSAGGSGFGGGGAGSHRESGAGGGYSGGGGGGSSGFPGGGGSYSNTGFAGYVSGSITAGGDGAGTGADGLVQISYTTLQLRKTTVNNIGTFSFSSPNLSTSPVSITTTVPGTPVAGAVIPLVNFSTSTVITEAAVAGFAATNITCTGIGAGTATPNLGARTVTLNAAATAPGNDIICTYTNTYSGPALIIRKTASTAGPVTVGQTITYTYEVTNPSTITINNVSVADVHNGFGTDPVPGSPVLFQDNGTTGNSPDTNPAANIWGTLATLDVLRFTGTYVVTQADIDNLQ